MKKIVSAILLSSLVSMGANAEEVEVLEKSEEKSDFYIVAKALATIGSSFNEEVNEESITLEGDTGIGLGIDFGYEISHGFAVEVDITYAANKVIETNNDTGDSEEFRAYYMTSSLDLAYRYMATDKLGFILKGGYEVEYEKIDTKDSATNDGFVYAFGAIYEINEHMGLLGEYEVTTVEGPRGNSAFVGIEYSF